MEAREPAPALLAVDQAELLGYDADDCSALRWDCWMLLGDFERAWRESDAIAQRGRHDPHRFWDGLPFDGKRVILRCLHGLGDAIQFVRYAPLIRSRAQHLVVEAHPCLRRVLACVEGVDEVITWGEAAPRVPPVWDSQVEVNELPRIFRTTVETIPAAVPYLRVGSARPKSRRAGVIWSSSQWNPARSAPIEPLLQAFSGTGWELVSLQHGPDRDRIPTASPNEGDVFDTAVDMLGMDLIVSVDTMTAHLAGALALPVFVLLPFQADWRWMLHREDSPWYPTMRLFRQPKPGDWESALTELRRAVLSL